VSKDGATLFDPERLAEDRQHRRDDPYRSIEALRRSRPAGDVGAQSS
jgi:hypothetical protein